MRRDWLKPGDWLVPLAVFGCGVLEAGLGILGSAGHAAVMLVLYGISCASLVVRRQHPMWTLLAVAACWTVQLTLALVPYAATGTAILTMAVFACGRYAPRPWAYLALPAGSVIALVSIVVDPSDTLERSWPWGLWVLPVFVLGTWFRQQRQHSEREATQRVRTAAAEERVQIARELHDVLAHSVTLMVVQAEAADELLERSPDTARASVRKIQQVGRDALQDTRRLLAVLRAPADAGLHAPLPGLGELPGLVTAMRSSGLPVDYRQQLDGVPVPDLAGRAAYRVVQEALTNTLRHAGPVPVAVDLTVRADRLVVNVTDEGTSRVAANPAGHGLIGMRERVEACGGLLVAEHTSAGFHVRAEIPLNTGDRA